MSTPISTRNEGAESYLLGYVLIVGFGDVEKLGVVAQDFHNPDRRRVWSEAEKLHGLGQGSTFISIAARLGWDRARLFALGSDDGANATEEALRDAAGRLRECRLERQKKEVGRLLTEGDVTWAEAAGATARLAAMATPEKVWQRFYYHGRGYTLVDRGRFIPLANTSDLERQLLVAGVPTEDLARTVCAVQTENFAAYSGPLAGWKAGIYDHVDGAGKILVTSSPQIIEAKAGDHELIQRIFRGLFSDPKQPDQLAVVRAWLKTARQNVKDGQRRPLPALAMVGPRNSGKTLALEIFRLALGRRMIPAHYSLVNEGKFNGALLDAELLVVDDEVASRTHPARTRFGQAIKTTLFANAVAVTRKNRESIAMRPVNALAIAVNDEAEHIQVLPPLDDSLRDKLTLLLVGKAELLPDETDDREKFMAKIEAELPGFLHELEAFQIPDHLRDTRTKAAAWQHPGVVALLTQISAEVQLRELLTQCDALTLSDSWTGSAAEVQRLLLNDPTTRHNARALLSWPAACGVYLGRLAEAGRGVKKLGQKKGIEQWEVTT